MHIAKPECPNPANGHGWQLIDGIMEPKWLDRGFIPQSLIDVLVEENILNDPNEFDSESDDESDMLYSLFDSDSDEDQD